MIGVDGSVVGVFGVMVVVVVVIFGCCWSSLGVGVGVVGTDGGRGGCELVSGCDERALVNSGAAVVLTCLLRFLRRSLRLRDSVEVLMGLRGCCILVG